jgi:hypothetical protein
MQRYLIAVVFIVLAVLPLFALAEDVVEVRLPVACVSQKLFLSTVNEYEELPFVRGISTRDGGDNSIVLFLNPREKNWTIVERSGTRYCILAVGEGMEPVPFDIIENYKELQKKNKM